VKVLSNQTQLQDFSDYIVKKILKKFFLHKVKFSICFCKRFLNLTKKSSSLQVKSCFCSLLLAFVLLQFQKSLSIS